MWNGPPGEVLHDLEVDTYLPTYPILPLKLPLLVNAFASYMLTLTLSLYLFNLLPLPHLDGDQFLDGVLELYASRGQASTIGDIELAEEGLSVSHGESRGGKKLRRGPQIKKAFRVSASCLIVSCIVLGALIKLKG